MVAPERESVKGTRAHTGLLVETVVPATGVPAQATGGVQVQVKPLDGTLVGDILHTSVIKVPEAEAAHVSVPFVIFLKLKSVTDAPLKPTFPDSVALSRQVFAPITVTVV